MCLKSSGATQTAGRQDCRKTGHGKGAVINYTRKEVGKKHGNSKQKFKIPAASVCNMISLPHRKCSFGFIVHPYNLCHATSIVKLIAYLPCNKHGRELIATSCLDYVYSFLKSIKTYIDTPGMMEGRGGGSIYMRGGLYLYIRLFHLSVKSFHSPIKFSEIVSWPFPFQPPFQPPFRI